MLENKLFEALLDVVPFGAYAVDVNNYEVVYANKLIRENMYAPQEQKCWQKIYGRDEKCLWCSIGKQISEKQNSNFFDEIDDKWIKTYDEFIGWPDGRDIKYSILVDITEQKSSEGAMIQAHAKLAVRSKQLVKTNQNLQITKLNLQKTIKELEYQREKAQNAVKYKSEFLANISHEIRTPMNGIIGMSHLALQSQNSDEQKKYIKKIDHSAKSLLGIINDILDFSKMEAFMLKIQKVEFDMYQLIDNVIEVMWFEANEKKLNITKNYADDIEKYYFGDSLRITQILTNFLSNAIKFTDTGKINISISKSSHNILRFTVTDTGIGLNIKEQENLFTAFAQADGSITRKYGGTGLGLSISKQLVELMGGKIWVDSVKGIGSSFVFEIELHSISKNKVQDIDTPDNTLDADNIQNITSSKTSLKQISHAKIDELFLKLEEELKTNKPKNCMAVINDIDTYLLDEKDTKTFQDIKKIIKKYKFKEAIAILGER